MAGRKYSKEQKDEFFRLLDKGGTVRAAARAVGVHQDADYNWLRNSGLTMQRATPRTYTPEDKAEFFRRLADNPNVSAVARELGFTRITCYSWAYKAGIRTSEVRKVNPRREEFLRLRAEGLTRAQARARVSDVYGFRRSLTVRYRDMVHGQSGGASLSVCRKQPSLSLIPM